MPAQKEVEIAIKPGWKAGTKVKFEGLGDESPGRPPRDLVFIIKEKPDPRFTRDGNNLQYTAKLPLKDALLGTTLEIETLDDRKIRVPIELARPGDVKLVPGEGMPLSKSPGKKGDLFIKFDVEFPRSLSAEQKAKIREARL